MKLGPLFKRFSQVYTCYQGNDCLTGFTIFWKEGDCISGKIAFCPECEQPQIVMPDLSHAGRAIYEEVKL